MTAMDWVEFLFGFWAAGWLLVITVFWNLAITSKDGL